MSDIVIKVENIWKEYHLGVVSHHSMAKDLQSWWARVRGKEDPDAPVGSTSGKSKVVSGKRSNSPHSHTHIPTHSSTPHFYLFHQAILQAYHKSVRTAILEGSDQLLIMIVVLAGLFLFHWRSSMLLLSSMVIGLAGVLILRSLIRVKGLLTVDMKHLYWDSRFSAKVVEFGYGVALWLFLSHLIMAIDRFVIMEYMGYKEAGMYSALKDIIFKAVAFASFPIYLSYQDKILISWNSRHREDTWTSIKEALSFEILIFIIFFIFFMVFKEWLIRDLLMIPKMDLWLIYLPMLLAAFIWQAALLLQRFLELSFKYAFMLLAIGLIVLLNLGLNIVLVPRYGAVASSLILLLTSLLYAGFIVVLSLVAAKRLSRE